MRGSKYVQSNMGAIFPEIKKELEKGRYLLFTGTPCQTAGLRAFLGKSRYEKLILCDLVCLGVPSPRIWGDYAVLLGRKKGERLDDFRFRDKSLGWLRSAPKAYYVDGSAEQQTELTRGYASLFYRRLVLRPSCYCCPFPNFRRASDITIADFWGVEKQKPEFFDDKGISLVLANTPAGSSALNSAKSGLLIEPSSAEECAPYQVHLLRPAELPPERKAFWKDYSSKGLEYVLQKYAFSKPRRDKIKIILKRVLVKMGLFHIVKALLKKRGRTS